MNRRRGGDTVEEKRTLFNNIISAHGEPRALKLEEGWYVLGYGYLIRCANEENCTTAIEEFKKIHKNILLEKRSKAETTET
jgi:hypothetical protein